MGASTTYTSTQKKLLVVPVYILGLVKPPGGIRGAPRGPDCWVTIAVVDRCKGAWKFEPPARFPTMTFIVSVTGVEPPPIAGGIILETVKSGGAMYFV